ncbi:MAG TPA: hypothetical protein PLJ43_07660 [Chitinophagales bacterium]|nr:hypothetical protein [Chitinophagales bacterium]HMZ88378.1 hypothetical protein [Chitinophagales bacterium]HNA57981.1 hypothetical protein [Chitinophagales bacterium]HNE45888.1 hypothetical protein [Chitinophagales bacterium]HNO28103.1 hypothetical protein [Chitinophagales bacterium]
MRQGLILISSVYLLAVSCAKDEVIHENLIIDGNIAPPVTGVSEIALNNYINSLYIDLFGRTATADELSEHAETLQSEQYSIEAREELVNSLLSDWEHINNIHLTTGQKFLVDVDSFAIASQIAYWDYLIDLFTDMGMEGEAGYYIFENDRLIKLITAHIDLANGTIGADEFYRRYINNYFYDQVNMGSLNFVVSCFTNLMQRYPTDDEQESGINMVDGVSDVLFLQDGSSKGDFIDIVTSTPEFFQGLVIESFNTYLARDPNSLEMDTYTQQMMLENNVNGVALIILTSTEYAGF